MKKLFILLLSVFQCSVFAIAQHAHKTALIKGRLVNATTLAPLNDKKITLKDLDVFSNSDGDGKFEFSEIPFGAQMLQIKGNSVVGMDVPVNVDKDLIEIGDIQVTVNENNPSADNVDIPTIVLEEGSTSNSDQSDDDNSGGSEFISAGRDRFLQATLFNFGYFFFRPRGERVSGEVQVNGITVNNALTNFLSWSQQMGGQSDVFHSRDVRYGLDPSPYSFGGANGSTFIQSTAADFAKGTRISYTAADRTFRNKVMVTTSTGIMKNGWAFTFSANKQWGHEGYKPGTFYNGYAYYAGASKIIGKGTLNLTTFGVPVQWANGVTATKECFNLTGDKYYNADWGYYTQGGTQVKRATNVQNVYQPTTILNYEYKPNEATRWNTAVAYQFGEDRKSGLDWYNANNPYGNYYSYLPSYWYNYNPPNTIAGDALTKAIKDDPSLLQINWNRLYSANELNTQTMNNVNGVTGASYTGKQSSYVLADKVKALKKLSFNTNAEHSYNEHLTVYGGVSFYSQQSEMFKRLTDLLGGDYFVNFNQFATPQSIGTPTSVNAANPNFVQNDLNHPNQVVKVGDKYGYDYTIHMTDVRAWTQAEYATSKVKFFGAISAGDNSFFREGFMRNGLFANNSFGKSSSSSFLTFSGKGGVTYKINPRNYLFVNAGYYVAPPLADNTFISAATRDFTVSNPVASKTQAIEGGYLLHSEKVEGRAVFYLNTSKDLTEIKRFYDDDPAYQTFVNYVMQNEQTRSIGTELMLNYKLPHGFSLTAVAAIGNATFTDRPNISVFLDNDTSKNFATNKAYIKNYHLGVGPQSVYTLGINYRSDNYWNANINFNYAERNYIEINPNRRTQAAIDLVTPGSAQMASILDQEVLPAAFTVDIHVGKSIQVSRKSGFVKKIIGDNGLMSFNLGVNNLLNNTNIIVRGYEQYRYDFKFRNPNEYANNYQYGYGITYYANVVLKF